jgi:hypothetical protein
MKEFGSVRYDSYNPSPPDGQEIYHITSSPSPTIANEYHGLRLINPFVDTWLHDIREECGSEMLGEGFAFDICFLIFL